MGLLKRLLSGSNRGRSKPPAEEEAAGAAVTSASAPSSFTVLAKTPLPAAQWPVSLQVGTAGSQKPLVLANPRRVQLGGLPAQLAALEARFAQLPAHPTPSKAALQARLAAHAKPAADAKPASGAKQPAGRSPRRGPKTLRRPRSLRRQGSSNSAAAAAVAAVAQAQPQSAGKLAKLAQLKQRQVRRSGDGASPAVASLAAAASRSASCNSPELELSSGAWTAPASRAGSTDAEAGEAGGQPPARQRALAVLVTPRLAAAAAAAPAAAAAAQQPQPKAAAAASLQRSAGSGFAAGGGSGRCSPRGDLALTLAPWAERPRPAAAAAAEQHAVPAVAAASPNHHHHATPLRRPSRAELPPDLLSLGDAVSLARPVPKRRALSVQEPAAAQQDAPAPPPPASHTATAAAAGEALTARSGEHEGIKRLMEQRKHRKPGWQSDFAGAVPGWRYNSQVSRGDKRRVQGATVALAAANFLTCFTHLLAVCPSCQLKRHLPPCLPAGYRGIAAAASARHQPGCCRAEKPVGYSCGRGADSSAGNATPACSCFCHA